MENYSSVYYKNSFLNQVIVRIDFLQFVPNEIIFQESIEKDILKIFSQRGKDQIMRFNSINLIFDPNSGGVPNANGETKEGIQHEYYSSDRKNKIIISNMYLVFEINNYTCFDEHKKWFETVVASIFQKARISIKRTGIRYINLFDQNRIKLQKNYFSSEIASSLQLKANSNENTPKIVRSMHMTEYHIDSMILNFRFGMYNPDYPNVLRKNDYVLDFDFFTNELIDSSDEILRVITKGHEEIQALFEASITDALREAMNK